MQKVEAKTPKTENPTPTVQEVFGKDAEVIHVKKDKDVEILKAASEIQQQKDAKLTERMTGFVSGKIPAPNPVVEYMLKQLQQCQADFEATQANLREGNKQIKALETQAITLKAQFEKYVQDIEQWDRPLTEADLPPKK